MRWLDLFCGAGCVADGLIAAGDQVIGLDIKPQPHYPGEFHQMDVTRELFPYVPVRFMSSSEPFIMFGKRIDAIWASPPCLKHTEMKHAPGAKGDAHPDLITPTRAFCIASGLPYAIENVPGAPLIDPVTICGDMFDLGLSYNGRWLRLERHRIFETNWPLTVNNYCRHVGPAVSIIGSHARLRSASAGGRGTADFVDYPAPSGMRHRLLMGRAFGMPDDRKITCKGISDGIPPAYARYIAEQLHRHLGLT